MNNTDQITINSKETEKVSQIRYLSFNIDKILHFNDHIDKMCQKIGKKIGKKLVTFNESDQK